MEGTGRSNWVACCTRTEGIHQYFRTSFEWIFVFRFDGFANGILRLWAFGPAAAHGSLNNSNNKCILESNIKWIRKNDCWVKWMITKSQGQALRWLFSLAWSADFFQLKSLQLSWMFSFLWNWISCYLRSKKLLQKGVSITSPKIRVLFRLDLRINGHPRFFYVDKIFYF